jgi:hypothetical protein
MGISSLEPFYLLYLFWICWMLYTVQRNIIHLDKVAEADIKRTYDKTIATKHCCMPTYMLQQPRFIKMLILHTWTVNPETLAHFVQLKVKKLEKSHYNRVRPIAVIHIRVLSFPLCCEQPIHEAFQMSNNYGNPPSFEIRRPCRRKLLGPG